MRDLLISEQSHVYGATGRSKSCYTPPKSCKASKSKKIGRAHV